ncbi:MAG TPA: helix-turn-helix transcriptional regulator [Vicinamibacterales bacterium]|nr:helix-turn-helix transcriptional regulator [Vicinamibacterales bacterium]
MSSYDMSPDKTAARAKPLSEPVFWILLSLAAAPQHGYALMKDVADSSEGRVRLTTGTLYGALARLLEDGWIERFDARDTSRDKQAYRLTGLGRTRLRDETERLRHVARTAAARLKSKEA